MVLPYDADARLACGLLPPSPGAHPHCKVTMAGSGSGRGPHWHAVIPRGGRNADRGRSCDALPRLAISGRVSGVAAGDSRGARLRQCYLGVAGFLARCCVQRARARVAGDQRVTSGRGSVACSTVAAAGVERLASGSGERLTVLRRLCGAAAEGARTSGQPPGRGLLPPLPRPRALRPEPPPAGLSDQPSARMPSLRICVQQPSKRVLSLSS